MDKFILKNEIKLNIKNKISKHTNSNLFELTDFGIVLKNYEENNSNIFRIPSNPNSDLLKIISYYLNHNKWKVQNHKNDTLHVLNKTLSYALSITCSMYEINLTDDGPNFILHTNTDIINKDGFISDGEIKYNDFTTLYRWIIYVTDYFNLYYIYYYKKGVDKKIFFNHKDCPILPKTEELNINANFPIFSWSTTEKHSDVLLPMPDIIMRLFRREFYFDTQEKKYIDFNKKTNVKCVFRGNMTNELRIKAHVISLENPEIFDFITSIGNPKLIFTNRLISDEQTIDKFNNSNDYRLSSNEQQKYKYILNIDGVASAWRIFSEIFYDSVMFIAKSPYVDIIKQSLIKNIHYVEIDEDLENIKNVYECINSNEKMCLAITKNTKLLSQKLNNIDIHLRIMHEKIEKKNYNCTYNDLLNLNYDVEFKNENVKNNNKFENNFNNTHVFWKNYINGHVFSKKITKNLDENKNKYVLCRPEGGFVDMIHAISSCYTYCQSTNRILLIDTENTTYKINFADIFNICELKNKLIDVKIIHDNMMINNIINNNNFSKFPEVNLNPDSKFIYSEETHNFYDENIVLLKFSKKIDYDQDILYYRQHRRIGDSLNSNFLQKIKLNNDILHDIYQKFCSIPQPFLAIHVRNTDMNSDYVKFYNDNINLIDNFENIYLATDSLDVLNFFKDKKKNLYYFTIPNSNKPMHYNFDETNKINVMVDLLTDIFICSEANHFVSANMNSGFSQFIQYIINNSFDKKIMFDKDELKNKHKINCNISKPILKNNKIFFLTFGAGNVDYHNAVARICKQAQSFGIFDEIIGLTENDLKNDSDFWEKHKNFVLNNKRGFGYWIWKPYLIHKIMSGKMSDGDIIFYSDCGCELNVRGKQKFFEYLKLVEEKENLAFQIDFFEKNWSKMDLIKILGMENDNTGQIQATVQFYKKSQKNLNILSQIYKLCTIANYHYVDDSISKEKNHETFKEHRHEQSILSLLFKKNNCFFMKDETYFDPEWKNGAEYPIWTMRNKTGKSLIQKYI